MCRYLSRHWGAALSANQHLNEHNGKVCVRKTVLQLWKFACKMREHRNLVLHIIQLETLRIMHNAENNDVIMKLCKKLETYTVQDHWYF
jgi:hypothetical protein